MTLQHMHERLLTFGVPKADLLEVHHDHLREFLEKLVCVQTWQQLPEPLYPRPHRQLPHLFTPRAQIDKMLLVRDDSTPRTAPANKESVIPQITEV